jgi:MOSC domain-containing protein YiiM
MQATIPRIFQINASSGGVPKPGIHTATVNELGITIDKQRDLKHHGGPERALCLYSLEQILALQQEGHPIFPGAVGENITTYGIDLGRIEPGTRLRLGSQVLIEITSYTTPCSNIAAAFDDDEFIRISQKVNPGWSRLYARVISHGAISVGDVIELQNQTETQNTYTTSQDT